MASKRMTADTKAECFNHYKAIAAQEEYCKTHQRPMFAPMDGMCYHCCRDIYAYPYGITIQSAGSRLITGCPYCNATFVD